jgi:hypothetical protein
VLFRGNFSLFAKRLQDQYKVAAGEIDLAEALKLLEAFSFIASDQVRGFHMPGHLQWIARSWLSWIKTLRNFEKLAILTVLRLIRPSLLPMLPGRHAAHIFRTPMLYCGMRAPGRKRRHWRGQRFSIESPDSCLTEANRRLPRTSSYVRHCCERNCWEKSIPTRWTVWTAWR